MEEQNRANRGEAEMKKRVVQIGTISLGEGMPKVCVPVMGKDVHALEDAAMRAEQADVLELRLDSVSPEMRQDLLCEACRAVRKAGKPVLATMRTARDGGAGECDAEKYEDLLNRLIREKLCDAVDVELSIGDAAFLRIAGHAHAEGLPVVGSYHDFEGTPAAEKMAARLQRMAALGADICKIAVMPHSRKDVVALTAACVQADDELAQPVIAIAMGTLGAATRICGEAMGSCLTFGTAGEASAPGQVDAKTLRQALEMVHEAMNTRK